MPELCSAVKNVTDHVENVIINNNIGLDQSFQYLKNDFNVFGLNLINCLSMYSTQTYPLAVAKRLILTRPHDQQKGVQFAFSVW